MKKTQLRFVVVLLGLIAVAGAQMAQADGGHHKKRFTVDVAMDGFTFLTFGPFNDAGFPADGTTFVTQGYIYPKGTLEKYGYDSGVNADGSAQFPDLVIGHWICRGWHLQDGDALTGPVVITTQTFDFDEELGRKSIVTDGIELADFFVPFRRAIVGGTGPWSRARGEMSQVYVGVNPSFGFNSTFHVRVR